jgi:hypothetical protein
MRRAGLFIRSVREGTAQHGKRFRDAVVRVRVSLHLKAQRTAVAVPTQDVEDARVVQI